MDNNRRVEMDRIEYESMRRISKINSAAGSETQIKTCIPREFKDVMKKTQNSSKKKKASKALKSDDDIIVESSLQDRINENNKVCRNIEEKISSSKVIKKLLYEDEEKTIYSKER